MDILEFDPTHFHSSSESVCHYFLVNLIHFTSICSLGFPFFFYFLSWWGQGEAHAIYPRNSSISTPMLAT